MSAYSPVVNGRPLNELIRQIIADVLLIPPEEVQPGKALVRDLGAESLDFMDLVFRLEDELGVRIPYQHWQRFINETLQGQELDAAITPEVVQQFAEQELEAC